MSVIKIGRLAACAFLFSACSNMAMAATTNISAGNPQSIFDAMKTEGYTATFAKDQDGDPEINVSLQNGSDFTVLFYGCVEHAKCETVMFSSGYNKADSQFLMAVTDWNRANRWTRALITDDGHPHLEMDIDLRDGGISPALFSRYIKHWAEAEEEFEQKINWDSKPETDGEDATKPAAPTSADTTAIINAAPDTEAVISAPPHR